MMMTRTRLVALFAYACAAGVGFACTAILAPQDDVQRCATADDCDDTGDPRHVPECRFDRGSDLDTTEVDKICVASFRVVSCDPTDYTGTFFDEYERLTTGGMHYLPCPATDPAPRGCKPTPGVGCEGDLVENALGFCDAAGAESPAFNPGQLDTDIDVTGQDITDAFCQSFFCEGDWVCDRAGNNTCVRCDPEAPIGEGGCGTVFIDNAPSCIYPGTALGCGDGNTDLEAPRFGTCP